MKITDLNGCSIGVLAGLGNIQDTGQVLLSTIGEIRQPNSEKYETVASLLFVSDEYVYC